MAAFYTLPISIFALIACCAVAASEGPAALLGVLKLTPLIAIGTGALFYARRLQKELKLDQQRTQEDARRTEARARTLGTLPQQARDIAGPRRALPSPAAFVAAPEQIARVRCTWCGTYVSVALADAASGEVSCPSCTTRFSMRDEMQKKMGNRPPPVGLDVQPTGSSLTIAHETNPGSGVGLVLVAAVVFVCTIPEGINTGNWVPTLLVGLPLVVTAVASYLWSSRRTEYSISGDSLIVHIIGFPARTVGQWQAGDVEQVFVRERQRTHTERDVFTKRKKRVMKKSYDVVLRDVADKETRLAKDLTSLDWALFIEQEIENRLSVVDRPVGKGPRR